MDFRDRLSRDAAALGLTLSERQQDQLMTYLALLHKWNRAYNLSAIRDPHDMLSLHVIDSLAVAPYLQGERFADVGTGAGLPGIPLAILFPERQFHLIDSNGKKVRFLFQVRTELGLDNVVEQQVRVESLQLSTGFDGILSRAFASLADMVQGCGHLLAPGGRCYAMKGQWPENELSELPKPFKVWAAHALSVPGVNAERHLLILGRDTENAMTGHPLTGLSESALSH